MSSHLVISPKPGVRKARARKPAAGFTLLELILVLFIVLSATALAVPNFYRSDGNRLRKEARMTADVLKSVIEEVELRKETIPVTFDLDDSTLAWKTRGGSRKEKLETLRAVAVPGRGVVREGEVKIFIEPVKIVAPIRVLLELEETGQRFEVSLNPLSRRTKVESLGTDLGKETWY